MKVKSFLKNLSFVGCVFFLLLQTGCVVESISGTATNGSVDADVPDPENGNGGEDESAFDYQGCVSGQGVGTKSIELNFLFPAEATKVRVKRNGNSIAEFSEANATTSHIDDDGLREGATYLYTSEAFVDGLWAEGNNTLQLSTLAVNAPTFTGIDDAVAVDAHSVRVTWTASIVDDPVSAYSYKIFANIGTSVDWTALPRATVLQGSPSEAVIANLGDELDYSFGVRACSEGDVCETNVIERSVLNADDGAPLTTGATILAIENGVLKITAPWLETDGGIARRYIYIRTGAVGGTNIGDYTLERTYVVSGVDRYDPPQELEIFPLQEGITYNVIVQDEDPSGNKAAIVGFETIVASDITPPSFSGISSLALGTPQDSVLTVSWTGIDTEAVDPLNGGDKYKILALSASAPIVSDPCSLGTEVAELNVADYTAGITANYDLTGLNEKTYYKVCVKAVDLAGNYSNNNNSINNNTLDVTAPDFVGLQAISYDNQSASLNLSWNESMAADIEDYQVTLWVNQPTPPPLPTVIFKSHADFSTGASISNVEFSLADNDQVYALVEACDDTEPPFGVKNCSAVGIIRSTVVPDVTPPAGFLGIEGPTEIGTPLEGELLVKWHAPGDWSDYRGFKIYQVDPLTSDITLMKNCPCIDYGCTDQITQCSITGLNAYRTYRLHVRAYDQSNNETLYLDPSSNYTDKRTIDTTPPAFASNLVVGPSPIFELSWNPGVDNQYALEPGAEVTYKIYQNNTAFDFSNPVQPDGNLKIATTDLSYQDGGFVEAQSYFYTVCATDASANTYCDQLTRNFTVPDVTAPEIINLVSTKTLKSKVWELNWEMSDNISATDDLFVEIRRKVSIAGDLATGADEVVYTGLGSSLVVAGNVASTTVATSLDPLSGVADLDRKINYLFTVRDEEGNESTSNITVESNNGLIISSVKGSVGPTTGGKLVTIYGSGFSSLVDNGVGEDTSVTISGNDCTGVVVLSENAMTCTTPAVGVAGSVEARVKTLINNPVTPTNKVYSESVLNNGYTYSATPILCDDPGSWDVDFADGTGISSDPYIVCNATHLENIKPISSSGAFFKLGDTIDLNGVSFDPIGNVTTKFTGNFDGDGHVILDWTYNNAQPNIGFFGYVSGDFEVSNLGLVNVDITATQSVGGIIGVVEGGVNKTGIISNVFVTGSVTADDFVGGLIGRKQNNHVNFNVIDSYFVGDIVVNGITGYGGGIAGFLGADAGGDFQTVYAEGSVTGTKFLGGLFGNLGENKQVQGSFSRAVVAATGNNAGGIAGEVKVGALVIDTHSELGTVSGVDNIGGLVGLLEGGIEDSYSDMVVTSTGRRAGGAIGYADGATMTGIYTTRNHNVNDSSGGLVGEMSDSSLTESYALGGVTSTGVDVGGLVGKVFTSGSGAGSITKSYSKGLIDTTGSAVGGLVGTIESLANSTVDLSEVFSTSQVGTDFALSNQQYGGLVGRVNTSAGSVVNITNCYATGAVYAGSFAGGLMGGFDFTGGTINIDYCFAATPIPGGNTNRGGIFGKSDVALTNISNSFWDTDVSEKTIASTNGGFTGTANGHTTVEMQNYVTPIYVGWDFTTVWFVPVSGYPKLQIEN
ncbi:MAG: IPT/TIG domain-containing protein [Bdellovibrionales bacterium]